MSIVKVINHVYLFIFCILLAGCPGPDTLYHEALGNCTKARKDYSECMLAGYFIEAYCREQSNPDSPYYEPDESKRIGLGLSDTVCMPGYLCNSWQGMEGPCDEKAPTFKNIF